MEPRCNKCDRYYSKCKCNDFQPSRFEEAVNALNGMIANPNVPMPAKDHLRAALRIIESEAK